MSLRKRFANNSGQSIVEITLITPLLLLALYVSIDFGILFFTANYQQMAAREGARIGSILRDCAVAAAPCVGNTTQEACPGTAKVVTEVCTRLPNRLTAQTVTIALTGSLGDDCMREVRVTASGTYNYALYRVIALFGMPVPTPKPLSRSAVARYQGQPVAKTGSCP